MKPHCIIDDWQFMHRWFPKKVGSGREILPCLYGRVSGHPRIPDGHRIVTSPIIDKDEVAGVVETENTIYLLGERPL